MAAHARLKNEFTEDEKCHDLMRWLSRADQLCSNDLPVGPMEKIGLSRQRFLATGLPVKVMSM